MDHSQTSQISSTDTQPSSSTVSRKSSCHATGDKPQGATEPGAVPTAAPLPRDTPQAQRTRTNSVSAGGSTASQPSQASSSKHRRKGPRTNYRHFPGGDETTPRIFSTVAPSLASGLSAHSDGSISAAETSSPESTAESEPTKKIPLPLIAAEALGGSTSLLPPMASPPGTVTQTQAPEVDYFSTTRWSTNSPNRSPGFDTSGVLSPDQPTPGPKPSKEETETLNEPKEEDPSESLPFNLSQYGIVHLPPLPPSLSGSEHSTRSEPQSPLTVPNSGSGSISQAGRSARRRRKKDKSSSAAGSSSGQKPSSGDGFPSSRSNSTSYHDASSRLSVSSAEPVMSFQFEHVEDADGHYIVIGREGKMEKCEDEPIQTPGAVQGFGVLMAVDDVEDRLVVRQVSENSTELLGLPPSYLFSLDCLSEALPESQVDVLWDNIHFLTEPDPGSDEDTSSPHVFLLSGWGAPGSAIPGDLDVLDGRRTWTCWCAAHRAEGFSADDSLNPGLIVIEFELERDKFNPLYPAPEVLSPTTPSTSSEPLFTHGRPSPALTGTTPSETDSASSSTPGGLTGDAEWLPDTENIFESTTSYSKPIPALERLRRMSRNTGSGGNEGSSDSRRRQRLGRGRGRGVGMMDVFAVMGQINEQIGAAPDLDMFLKIVAGVIKDLTQFHRVMVYQFDEMWNGQVVAELVDWSQSHDLFKGLHFPAADIPAQARQLYAINKVRLLYDRAQPNARIVCRSVEDLSVPLDMTQCYLRSMSPIHIKYLENMGVRASMSISIMAFNQLWGLVACHTYGEYGMRVSFPVRQILRLLSQSVSRNIERLTYAQRLHTRKLVNTITSEQHPTGYIVSNADDLLGLFDADYGILVIGEGAKIIGPNQHGQEILIMAEYLRLKQFDTIQASQSVIADFPDLKLTTGLEIIAGLLYVPLSRGGTDFIAFLRRGQPRQVNWAGRPLKEGEVQKPLEPRTSFKIWSETVAGRCRAWTDEQLETAGVLALVYGKFIEVWRQKQTALQNSKLTNLILNNASHEVRTPLNHIINYLEMALNGSLDHETRENLSRSHAASKSLLFTINDLLDLTKIESGNETSFHEPFSLHSAIEDSTEVYKREAERRGLTFNLDLASCPSIVVGDAKKIRTVVQNLTANALKYTTKGSITVTCTKFDEPEGLRDENQVVVEIIVADTGCGIEGTKLESIFREFEQVEYSGPKPTIDSGVGLGLAVVGRIVEQLGGQLRVDSAVSEGSKFSFLIPLALSQNSSRDSAQPGNVPNSDSSNRSAPRRSSSARPRKGSAGSSDEPEFEGLVEALTTSHLPKTEGVPRKREVMPRSGPQVCGKLPVPGRSTVRPVKIDLFNEEATAFAKAAGSPLTSPRSEKEQRLGFFSSPHSSPRIIHEQPLAVPSEPPKLRALIVEDNDINRIILAKRLSLSGHSVVNTTNGQEALSMVEEDQEFDVVFMDIQMPILNGFEATEGIRKVEPNLDSAWRLSRRLNNNRIPIFAVSASLKEEQREDLIRYGMDGWILKPIDFKRLNVILKGVLDPSQRQKDLYRPGYWESGGWLTEGASGIRTTGDLSASSPPSKAT